MHTNIDNARGGVNFKIAEKMELEGCRFFAGKTVDGIECGSGVIGELPEELAADDFILMLKRVFDVECVECNQLLRRPIKRVAIVEAPARSFWRTPLLSMQTPSSQAKCIIMSISDMNRRYR